MSKHTDVSSTPQSTGFPLTELLSSDGGDSHGITLGKIDPTESIISIIAPNGLRQREHYHNNTLYRCHAQTVDGKPSDASCLFCTAARIKKKVAAKTRIFTLAVDRVSGAVGFVSWNETKISKPGKNGEVTVHQAMRQVLGTGMPTKPFCLHKQEQGWLVTVEFPVLPADIAEPSKDDLAAALEAWAKFDPATTCVELPEEALAEEFPDLVKYSSIR